MRLTRITATAATVLAVAALLTAPAVAQSTSPAGAGAKHSSVRHAAAVAHPDYAGVPLPGGTTGPVHYATLRPSCGTPSPGQLSCQAVVRVPATAETPGAIAYRDPDVGRGPAGGFTPADLAKAYSVNPSTSTNAVVGIVDAFNNPYARSELDTFDQHYGFAQETARSFRQVGQTGSSKLPRTNWDWGVEIALDLQAVRAMCRHCRILLVEAKSPTQQNLATAENTAVRLGASIVSNSYGGPERGYSPKDRSAYNHPGVAIVASTGDDGWYSWDYANSMIAVGEHGVAGSGGPNVPAAYPSVIAVGGTTLTVGSNGKRVSETVWNSNGAHDWKGLNAEWPLGASGGGCSLLFAAQWWQRDVNGYAQTGCGAKRLAGDVSIDAAPVPGFGIFAPVSNGRGSWAAFGGTSLSSPLIAAMIALAGGPRGVAYPAESIYRNAQYRPHSYFDVTTGGNSFCGGDTTARCSVAVAKRQPGQQNPNALGAGMIDCAYPHYGKSTLADDTQCNAASGYDGPSGIGVPVGTALLHSSRPHFLFAPTTTIRARTEHWYTTADFADPIGKAVSWTFRWGDGSAAQTGTRSRRTHSFAKAGTYRVSVSVLDNRGQSYTTSSRISVLPAQ